MRYSFALTTIFIAWLGVSAPVHANAGVAPGVTGLMASHVGFNQVGWHRYYGYPGPYAAPRIVVVPQPPLSCRLWSPINRSWSWCRRRVRRAAESTAIGTASIASTRATTGLISGRGRRSAVSGQSGFRYMLEVVLDLLDEEPPGLVLARTGGLFHCDLEIGKLALNPLPRQHMQAAR